MKHKIDHILTQLIAKNISRHEACEQLLNLNEKKVSIPDHAGCTCNNDQIYYDPGLDIIWCECGNLLKEINEPVLKKAGLQNYVQDIETAKAKMN